MKVRDMSPRCPDRSGGQGGANVVRHFVKSGAAVVISTPIEFFDQHLFESEDEHHRSHWTPSDMRDLARHVDYQAAEGGWVFLLSARKLDVRGFGCSLVKRLRRVARVLRSELK